MTVIINTPRVQYSYINEQQTYTITFKYIEREHVKVAVNDQELTYGVHYQVPIFDAESLEHDTLCITLLITPIENLDDDITIAEGDTITIYRATPFDQQQVFPQNSKFSSQKVTEALDKLTLQQQEQEDDLSRCLKMPVNIPVGFNATLPLPEPNKFLAWNEDGTQLVNDTTNAEKWAEWMDGPVDGVGYSAKWHAQEAAGYAQQVLDQGQEMLDNFTEEGEELVGQANSAANRAEQAAQECLFGMQWFSFNQESWILNTETNKYERIFPDVPVINSVYRGTWENKQLVVGVDIIITDTNCKLVSMNPFNGFALSNANLIGNYVFIQETASDIWVIDHNLGHIPRIIVMNDDNIEIISTREHPTFNQTILYFDTPQTGIAYLN